MTAAADRRASVHGSCSTTTSVADALFSGGCIIGVSTARRSLPLSRVRVNSYCQIEDAVILSNVAIGRGAKLRRGVIDKGTRVAPGLAAGLDRAADTQRFFASIDGICVITPDATAPGGPRP